MEGGKDRVGEMKKLFRIYKTVMQMMLDRGITHSNGLNYRILRS